MIRHVVLLKIHDTATQAALEGVWEALLAVGAEVPILDAAFSDNTSPEHLDRGYNYAFFMDFKDEATRDAYVNHPKHSMAATMLTGLTEGGVDGVLVFDLGLAG